eukprot:Rhum_TRINITY_DN12875_c0_g1::Rhum_TRINITY_DN12875_c0_g1_i1::g.54815::m.54815
MAPPKRQATLLEMFGAAAQGTAPTPPSGPAPPAKRPRTAAAAARPRPKANAAATTAAAPKAKPAARTQLVLDLGQDGVSGRACGKCGMVFTPGTADDATHRSYCGVAAAAVRHGWGVVHLAEVGGAGAPSAFEAGEVVETFLGGGTIVRSGAESQHREVLRAAVSRFARVDTPFEKLVVYVALDRRRCVLAAVFVEVLARGGARGGGSEDGEEGPPLMAGVVAVFDGADRSVRASSSSSSPVVGVSEMHPPDEVVPELLAAAAAHTFHGFTIPCAQLAVRSDVALSSLHLGGGSGSHPVRTW